MMKGRDRDHPTEKEVDMDSLLVLDSVGSADGKFWLNVLSLSYLI